MIAIPNLTFEKILWHSRLTRVAGLDEAGRGALAGPVAAGAVILPANPRLIRTLNGVRDSKLMTPDQRALWAGRIKSVALGWQVGFASADEIDTLGIVHATRLAALRALAGLGLSPDYLLTDFRLELPELETPQTALVKGDQKCLSIAAASVLAKTARDAMLCALESEYPGYGLERHKGYGTARHRAAIGRLGFSPIHRKTFTCKS
jgi:ribonuclease HII